MTLRPAALALAALTLTTAAFAAETNTFTLVKGTKAVGRASYTIDANKDSFHVKGRFEYRLVSTAQSDGTGGGLVTDAQFTTDYKVDLNGNYLSGYTQNGTNQTITSYQPDKGRTLVTIASTQGGISSGGKPLPVPGPHFLIAPDYDPSAIQVLLTTSMAHPHADSKYTFIVPGTGTGPRSSTTIVYIAINPAPEATGTLDGKPITLKHFSVVYAKGKADLYTDADGKLLQADMGTTGVSYVRNKFVLSPR
jgi:hypothetical protein